MQSWKWSILLLVLLSVMACNGGKSIDSKSFDAGCWSYDDTLRFEVEIVAENESAGIKARIHFTPDYPNNNIFLWLETTSPSGKEWAEPLEFWLMDASGKWFQGNSDNPEITLSLRPGNVFPETGTWKFQLVHYMQEDNLCGIESLQITKTE